MSAYIVVDISVHDLELFKAYARKSRPLVEKHGGRYLVRGGDAAIHEGTWKPERLVVVEFPGREEAFAFLSDPEYQPVATMRHDAATTNMIVVDGYEAGS